MSFDNNQPEPKNLYLNNLIALTFYTASELYRGHRYANAIYGMEQIIAMINGHQVGELKDIVNEVDAYASAGEANVERIKVAFRTLQKFLYEKWFSELHLGVVPTSTLPTTHDTPDNAPLSSTQTSRV